MQTLRQHVASRARVQHRQPCNRAHRPALIVASSSQPVMQQVHEQHEMTPIRELR